MIDTVFCKNFRFNEYRFDETQHRNNIRGVDFHYIGFMKHGRGQIVSEGQTLEIRESEMFYIPKGCHYVSHWIADDHVCFDSIGFLYFPTTAPGGYKLQIIRQTDRIWDAFAPLSQNKAVDATSIGNLYRLLGILEQILEPAPICRNAEIYEKTLRYMQEDPLRSIPHYARLCGVSESALYQHIKKQSGKTPNRIRQEVLCQKATELLTTTNLSIEEICEKLGFSSAAYFRKTFHSIYHKPPTQVRREGITL